jgi:MFS family permease
MGPSERTATVLKLGTAQTLAWGSTYYLPAVLAAPMARDLGLATPWVFGAFSLALVISGVFGPAAGRRIDTFGGRPMLMASNGVFALGLLALAAAQGPLSLFAAWALLGLGMSGGLYEAAFATLVRLYGTAARNPITGVTLLAGLASTVGWPLSTLFEARFGWRGACLCWAALHLIAGLPLNAWLPRVSASAASGAAGASTDPVGAGDAAGVAAADDADAGAGARAGAGAGAGSATGAGAGATPILARPRLVSAVLAFLFAATAFISTAMAAHLPGLLQAAGASLPAAVAAGALVGPAQVAGRLLEFGLLRRAHPVWSARAAALGHPLAAAAMSVLGAVGAAPFALLHGLGNGILTITKGTLPLALFGPQGYGQRQGRLMLPARVAAAAAPLAFGLVLERWGARSLWLSGALGLAAWAALAWLPASGSGADTGPGAGEDATGKPPP